MSNKPPGPRPMAVADVVAMGNRAHLTKAEIAARAEKEAAVVKPRPIRAADPPKDISLYAAECWSLHAPELDALGLLSVLDRGSFRLMCETYALARTALDELRPRKSDGTPDERRKGLSIIIDGPNGPRRHPALLVFTQEANAYRRWCGEFGLTPSARLGIRPAAGHSPRKEEDSDDDEGAFFGT